MKKSKNLKTFLILRVIKVKYNIELSRLVEMKTENGMTFLDLIILQKLSRIFMLVIQINRNLKQGLENKKGIDLLERLYIKTKR